MNVSEFEKPQVPDSINIYSKNNWKFESKGLRITAKEIDYPIGYDGSEVDKGTFTAVVDFTPMGMKHVGHEGEVMSKGIVAMNEFVEDIDKVDSMMIEIPDKFNIVTNLRNAKFFKRLGFTIYDEDLHNKDIQKLRDAKSDGKISAEEFKSKYSDLLDGQFAIAQASFEDIKEAMDELDDNGILARAKKS